MENRHCPVTRDSQFFFSDRYFLAVIVPESMAGFTRTKPYFWQFYLWLSPCDLIIDLREKSTKMASIGLIESFRLVFCAFLALLVWVRWWPQKPPAPWRRWLRPPPVRGFNKVYEYLTRVTCRTEPKCDNDLAKWAILGVFMIHAFLNGMFC